MSALTNLHGQLSMLPGAHLEPIQVWQCAEAYRAYWRPKVVRVIILAESHVYTTLEEARRSVNLRPFGLDEGPMGFVRLVYCLGYGENDLLSERITNPKNSGTSQYWQMLHSCISPIRRKEDYAPILKTRTRLHERIGNKVALLRQLQSAGIWLLDASVAALYPKPSPAFVAEAIPISWDSYVGNLVRDAKPSRIVCLGKGVHNALYGRLQALGVPFTPLPQPNARLSSEERFQLFGDCLRACE